MGERRKERPSNSGNFTYNFTKIPPKSAVVVVVVVAAASSGT